MCSLYKIVFESEVDNSVFKSSIKINNTDSTFLLIMTNNTNIVFSGIFCHNYDSEPLYRGSLSSMYARLHSVMKPSNNTGDINIKAISKMINTFMNLDMRIEDNFEMFKYNHKVKDIFHLFKSIEKGEIDSDRFDGVTFGRIRKPLSLENIKSSYRKRLIANILKGNYLNKGDSQYINVGPIELDGRYRHCIESVITYLKHYNIILVRVTKGTSFPCILAIKNNVCINVISKYLTSHGYSMTGTIEHWYSSKE